MKVPAFLFLVLAALSCIPAAMAQAPFSTGNGVVISDGDIVAGTAHIGPSQIQPHYLIDLDDPAYQDLVKRLTRELAGRPMTRLQEIDYVTQFVQRQFTHTNYDDEHYIQAALQHVKDGTPIKLSEIIKNKAAVCRGQNMLLHLLLKEQGIPTQYVTAKVGSGTQPYNISTEDHSFLTYSDPASGKKIALDAYFDRFHGQDYEKLKSENVDADGLLNAGRVRQTASTKDSVFPRVQQLPPERVAIIGDRGYKMKVDSADFDATTGTFRGDASYRALGTASGPVAPESCRKKILLKLLESL